MKYQFTVLSEVQGYLCATDLLNAFKDILGDTYVIDCEPVGVGFVCGCYQPV